MFRNPETDFNRFIFKARRFRRFILQIRFAFWWKNEENQDEVGWREHTLHKCIVQSLSIGQNHAKSWMCPVCSEEQFGCDSDVLPLPLPVCMRNHGRLSEPKPIMHAVMHAVSLRQFPVTPEATRGMCVAVDQLTERPQPPARLCNDRLLAAHAKA